MRTGIIKNIHEFMRRDKNIYFLTGDLGYSVLEAMQEDFPKRVINVGVAEQNMMSLATGLALSGKKVYVYSIIPFVTMRCYEQIRDDICYNNVDVTILGVGAGLSYGVLSATHFALEDIAILRPLPNLSIFSPADETEAVLGVRYLYTQKTPSYVRIGKKKEKVVYEKPYRFRFGKGTVISKGKDITVFATGPIISEVIQAVSYLSEKKGIKATVVDIHTIKPLDSKLIARESKNKKMVFTVEEHAKIGGLGSAVAEVLSGYKDAPILKIIGTQDRFIHEVGSQKYLRETVGLSPDRIAKTIEFALTL